MLKINLTNTVKDGDDSRSLIQTYLYILNVINPKKDKILTEGEVNILTEFILLPEKYYYQRFSKYGKALVLKNLKESHQWELRVANLNTKIYELIDKEYLWRDEDGVIYIKKWILDLTEKLLKDKEMLLTFHAN